MAGEINQISQAIGRIETKVDDLKEQFSHLPCGSHSKDIESLKSDRNKVVGIMAVLGVFFGAIGWFISPAIDWIIKHFPK